MHSIIQEFFCRISIMEGRTMTLPMKKDKQEHIGRVLKVVEERLSGIRAGNADFSSGNYIAMCRCTMS
jgi:hypothetical protein